MNVVLYLCPCNKISRVQICTAARQDRIKFRKALRNGSVSECMFIVSKMTHLLGNRLFGVGGGGSTHSMTRERGEELAWGGGAYNKFESERCFNFQH
jgi:hypothetical protein